MNKPLLGIDIGFKRTGLSLSESGILAEPLTTLEATPPHMQKVVQEIVEIIKEKEIATIVIGMPLSEDGKSTEQALKTAQVITQLKEKLEQNQLSPEVVEMNEYYSTQDAVSYYPGADKDAAAAALILQEYIDNQNEV